jgi:hypothetical protein
VIKYYRDHKSLSVLIGLVILTIFRILIPFSSGYYGVFNEIFLPCTETFRYALIAIFAIVTYISPKNRRHKLSFSILWVLLISVGLIPTGHFMTLGALLSIHNTDPTQIRSDARILMDELEQPTHFTNDTQQRSLINEFVPKDRLPPSLQNEVFNDVLVLEDNVFIEKFGLCCLFRGFVVFREGSDVWKNEKPLTLLDGCSYCWRIRILDGLYWYHAVPTEEEITTVFHPLK